MNIIEKITTQYLYYAIIALISIVMLFFLPMLGSEIGLQFEFPDTAAGWIVWSTVNLCSAAINVLMFHSFIKQAKVNVQSDKNYLEALRILEEVDMQLTDEARAPREWLGLQYKKKGITIFIFTLLGTISLGSSALMFDLTKFLVQLFSLLSGLVFGVIQMKATEEYWTVEFLNYAKKVADHRKRSQKMVEEAKRSSQIVTDPQRKD